MIKNSIIYFFLYILPKNFISCLMGRLVSIRFPKPMMLFINRCFVRTFKIDLNDAEKPLSEYQSLQELFIRRLKPGARNPSAISGVLSPCDGTVSVQGRIIDGNLIQAKGRMYTLKHLLGADLSQVFIGGHYATIYLSPRDYHRFHMPVDGSIEKTIYIPGSLWPVNKWAVKNVKELFCQNERVISLIKPKDKSGLIAQVAIGATMVGKIEMDYCTIPDYKKSKKMVVLDHQKPIFLNSGDDLGKFMFGSTIILLFSNGLLEEFANDAPVSIKLKQLLAKWS